MFHRQLSSYFSLDLATGFEENRETVCNHGLNDSNNEDTEHREWNKDTEAAGKEAAEDIMDGNPSRNKVNFLEQNWLYPIWSLFSVCILFIYR